MALQRYNSRILARPSTSMVSTNKVLRNTYFLLSLTLLFSAATAGMSMLLRLPHFGLFTLVGYFGLLFATAHFRNSVWGLVCVFALTGFMGLTLGPLLNAVVGQLQNGSQLVMTALGGTGVIFLGLSGYALVSRRDFSFLGGFLFIAMLVALVAGLVALIFSIPALSLAVSAAFLLLSSALILYKTSDIIHGGETNYIMATVTLYVSLYNIFITLLQFLAIFAGNRE